ncbi:hypothetical protein F4781DRAFT_427422 [Annulohypoxylon bovei var. microspora]|nr:hypothetical protein F4781DRAFT_427422 [Annulohypoxylon bovei var. microspora]
MATRTRTHPYTTPGIHNQPIPWHQRAHSAHHRPFGAYAATRQPSAPPPPLFRQPPNSYELEEQRKQAEWLEWQGRIATTGYVATLASAESALAGDDDEDSRDGLVEDLAGLFREVVVFVLARVCEAAAEYRRVARGVDRWYWLRLSAYRRSSWPQVFRAARYWAAVLLGVVVLAFVAKLQVDEYYRTKPDSPESTFVPQHQFWSVTPPRCSECQHCYDPTKNTRVWEVED